MKPITTRSRGWAAVLLVLAALGISACGGGKSGNSSSNSGGSSSTPAATSTPSTSTPSSSSNGIPQGPNAGDADSDNHGGPSDGDGNQ